MIINTLNAIAVMLAHTPDAAMSIPEQIMIQPPLSAILARPSIVHRVSQNAPYAALVIGFAMWGSRVAQMRQTHRPPVAGHANTAPFAADSETVGPETESPNGHESMPDTGPVWDALQTITLG